MGTGQEQDDQERAVDVEVYRLRVADSPRLAGEDPEHVEVLLAVTGPLPPIIVHRESMRVIDGMHRLRVAQRRGDRTVRATFFDGDDADAFVLAVRVNVAQGLPLSLADRKRAAARIIASHPQWSDRRIASAAGLAAGTVADVRRSLPGRAPEADRRVGQDGRVRPLDGSRARQIAYQLISQDPALPLREIARAAGISPETARDVRNRFARGDGPLPDARRTSRAGQAPSPAPALPVGGTPGRPAADGLGTPSGPLPVAGGWSGTAPSPERVSRRSDSVRRLRADPALRLTENGRNLLRLLAVNTLTPGDWEELVDNVPPHCSQIVAQLSRELAQTWAHFAVRLNRLADDMATTG